MLTRFIGELELVGLDHDMMSWASVVRGFGLGRSAFFEFGRRPGRESGLHQRYDEAFKRSAVEHIQQYQEPSPFLSKLDLEL